MKKQFLLSLVTITFAFSFSSADVAVQYRVSRTHGLIKFVMAISGEPHLSPNIKEAFQRSKFKDSPKVAEALKKIESVQNDLHLGMDYAEEKVSGDRRAGLDVLTFINIQSIFSTSIEDLSTRVMGMMPMSAHALYFSALNDLDPVYEEIFWRQSSRTLYSRQNELEGVAKKVKLSEMFKKVEKFYEASWPANTPFVIGLYPILLLKNYDKNQTSSQSLGNIEEHGIMVGAKRNDSGSFGVVFHELCHSVYGAQSPEVMAKWESYFNSRKSPYRLQARIWLNETLATVLGNGWAYKLENKDLEKESWYNHPIIDKFSKALYPKTMEYIEANKSFDQEYADFMIQTFSELFPDSINEYASLMNRVVIATDNQIPDQREFIRLLRKDIEISGIGVSSPLNNSQTISSIKEKSSYTLVVIFSKKNRASVKSFLERMPELGSQSKMFLSMKPRQIFSYQDANARSVIGIQIEKPQDLQDAVEYMKKNKINPMKPLTTF